MHERYSTSGFDVKYNHPFFDDDFVIIHNGVINQFLNGSGSDTFGFFKRFVKEFHKLDNERTSRNDKIIKIIKDLFSDDAGSFSILIYDKKTRYSYYFRNTPQIHFYKNDEYLFVTTEDDNREFLTLISDKKFTELDIQSRVVYQITPKVDVYICGRIKVVETEPITIVEEEPQEEQRVSFKSKSQNWDGEEQIDPQEGNENSDQKDLDKIFSEKEWDDFNVNNTSEKEDGFNQILREDIEGTYTQDEINEEIEKQFQKEKEEFEREKKKREFFEKYAKDNKIVTIYSKSNKRYPIK